MAQVAWDAPVAKSVQVQPVASKNAQVAQVEGPAPEELPEQLPGEKN